MIPQKSLLSIARRSMWIDEIAGDSTKLLNGSDQGNSDKYLEQWCKVAASGDSNRFHKRILWEGLSISKATTILQNSSRRKIRDFTWIELLQKLIEFSLNHKAASFFREPMKPFREVPFADALNPVVEFSVKLLQNQIGLVKFNFWKCNTSPVVNNHLRLALFSRLSYLWSPILEKKFNITRPVGKTIIAMLDIDSGQQLENYWYKKFTSTLISNGYLDLFDEYPVLGRLTITIVENWVSATSEFIRRLYEDNILLENMSRKNGLSDKSLGKIVNIQTGLSDFHNNGRSVFILTFSNGFKVVYKPKDVGIDIAFDKFINWINSHSRLLPINRPQIIKKKRYGWVEYVSQKACASKQEVRRYYYRAGAQLCLLYFLGATDYHHENIIADGEYPVLVDLETVMHPRVNSKHTFGKLADAESTAISLVFDSVLSTGLLPRWNFQEDGSPPFDVSGIGGTSEGQSANYNLSWKDINSDLLRSVVEPAPIEVKENAVIFNGKIQIAGSYCSEIIDGFSRQYRFLIRNKRELLASDSPITFFKSKTLRFIFRPTNVYSMVLQHALLPEYLTNGIDFSIELESLAQAFLVSDRRPKSWPILNEEINALRKLDIPHFEVKSNRTTLILKSKIPIREYFGFSSYESFRQRLKNADEIDLSKQVGFIKGAFTAQVADVSISAHKVNEGTRLPKTPKSESLLLDFYSIALDLGNTIKSLAIRGKDGSATWIGLVSDSHSRQFQYQPIGSGLYSGQSGIALALSALDYVSDKSTFAELVLSTLLPIQKELNNKDSLARENFAMDIGIGGGMGLGSIVYSFTKIGGFLKNNELLKNAHEAAHLISKELILSDRKLDVLSGTAGAILGLTSLYKCTRENYLLRKAILCGEHLLENTSPGPNNTYAWKTNYARPLTGFSHGSSGISYALTRLFEVSKDPRFLEAAYEGITFENSVFSKKLLNWPDFRWSPESGQNLYSFSWCHGAPGIGLARLGMSQYQTDIRIKRDIKSALKSTLIEPLHEVDQLCCGNMGIIEFILSAGITFKDQTLVDAAKTRASRVLSQVKLKGGFQLYDNLPTTIISPGMFQGIAGIGYELARLSNPLKLPSVLLWN